MTTTPVRSVINEDSSECVEGLERLLALYSDLFAGCHDSIESKKVGPIAFGRDELYLPFFNSRANGESKPLVIITGGIHGDEPSGVYAAAQFVKHHLHEFHQFRFAVFPCLNPGGFVLNTRANPQQFDLNRVFAEESIAEEVRLVTAEMAQLAPEAIAVFDLHEDHPHTACDFAPQDPAPCQYYMYQRSAGSQFDIAEQMVTALADRGFPICRWERIYGDSCRNGVIRVDDSHRHARNMPTMGRYLSSRGAKAVLTTEVPGNWRLEHKVEAHLTALAAGLDTLTIKLQLKRAEEAVKALGNLGYI